jgi:hypothetical protein
MNDSNVEDTWKQVQVGWNGVRKAIGETSKLQLPQTPAVSPSAPTPPAQRPVIVQPLQTQGITTTPLSVEPAKIDTAPVAKADAGERAVDLSLVDPKTEIVVRRGMPGNAEAIANFITRTTNKPIGRMDVMLAFGQKSYHIAYGKNEQVIALIGWQVENLITRVDEFYLSVGVPYNEIIHELISAIEDASRELQSEVSFVVLPKGTEQEITQAFLKNGYQVLNLNEVKFPAWREAAHEMISDNSVQALMKQLRADRVMKPI